MIPLLPFYAEKLGASAFQVGLLISAYAVCQLFSGPLLGKLSDRTGRKPLLLVSQAGTFIGFIVTAFAPTLSILLLARAIDGATAGNLSLAQAYISDITKPEDRSRSFGVMTWVASTRCAMVGEYVDSVLMTMLASSPRRASQFPSRRL